MGGREEKSFRAAPNNPKEMQRGTFPSLAASCCWRTPRPPGPGTRAAPELWKCEEFWGMAVQLAWDSGNLWGIPVSSPKTELVELRAGRLGLSCAGFVEQQSRVSPSSVALPSNVELK